MKKQSKIWGQIITIFVIGLVVSSLSGRFNLGEIFGNMDVLGIENVFDTLSIILAVLATLLGAAYLVYRGAQREDEGVWTEWEDDLKQ